MKIIWVIFLSIVMGLSLTGFTAGEMETRPDSYYTMEAKVLRISEFIRRYLSEMAEYDDTTALCQEIRDKFDQYVAVGLCESYEIVCDPDWMKPTARTFRYSIEVRMGEWGPIIDKVTYKSE